MITKLDSLVLDVWRTYKWTNLAYSAITKPQVLHVNYGSWHKMVTLALLSVWLSDECNAALNGSSALCHAVTCWRITGSLGCNYGALWSFANTNKVKLIFGISLRHCPCYVVHITPEYISTPSADRKWRMKEVMETVAFATCVTLGPIWREAEYFGLRSEFLEHLREISAHCIVMKLHRPWLGS